MWKTQPQNRRYVRRKTSNILDEYPEVCIAFLQLKKFLFSAPSSSYFTEKVEDSFDILSL